MRVGPPAARGFNVRGVAMGGVAIVGKPLSGAMLPPWAFLVFLDFDFFFFLAFGFCRDNGLLAAGLGSASTDGGATPSIRRSAMAKPPGLPRNPGERAGMDLGDDDPADGSMSRASAHCTTTDTQTHKSEQVRVRLGVGEHGESGRQREKGHGETVPCPLLTAAKYRTHAVWGSRVPKTPRNTGTVNTRNMRTTNGKDAQTNDSGTATMC